MWATIIEILERRWTERRAPRRQLVKDITDLHRAMYTCWDSFLRFSPEHEEYREEWYRDVEILMKSLKRVDPTLEIFGSNVRPTIHAYAMMEAWETKAMLTVTNDKGNDIVLLDLFGEAFRKAREDLNYFIMENFTIEEVHAFMRKQGRP